MPGQMQRMLRAPGHVLEIAMTSTPNAPSSTRIRSALIVLLGAVMLSTVGCAFGEFRPGDPFDRQLTLDRLSIDTQPSSASPNSRRPEAS